MAPNFHKTQEDDLIGLHIWTNLRGWPSSALRLLLSRPSVFFSLLVDARLVCRKGGSDLHNRAATRRGGSGTEKCSKRNRAAAGLMLLCFLFWFMGLLTS